MKPIYKYLDNPKYSESQHYFEVACAASRKHRDTMNSALEKYGDRGPLISGIGRDHFPEWVKNELRSLALEVSTMNDKGKAKRPRGTHKTTIIRLGHEVSYRFGTGFYGFSGACYGEGAKG